MRNSSIWLATRLLKNIVRNTAGETLGRVEDLALDASGNVQYAILSLGGVLGMGRRLYPLPWGSLRTASSGDYLVLDMDTDRLRDAPAFERDAWPDMNDVVWRDRVHNFYGSGREVIHERPVYAERTVVRRERHGLSVLGTILLICIMLGLGWLTYLVATRGWEQAKQDIKSTAQGAAYAAKETGKDAALTTKVKTALSLSKRIPSDKIDVDSQDDVVTLRGEVPNDQVRTAAEQIAQDVPGVSEVHNHLYSASTSQ